MWNFGLIIQSVYAILTCMHTHKHLSALNGKFTLELYKNFLYRKVLLNTLYFKYFYFLKNEAIVQWDKDSIKTIGSGHWFVDHYSHNILGLYVHCIPEGILVQFLNKLFFINCTVQLRRFPYIYPQQLILILLR